jgi:hypothetical protein
MAILAGEIVAGITLRRISNRRPDLVGGIGHQGIAVFDQLAERIVSDGADIGRRPLGQIDLRRIGGMRVAANMRDRRYRNHRYQANEPLHRILLGGICLTTNEPAFCLEHPWFAT